MGLFKRKAKSASTEKSPSPPIPAFPPISPFPRDPLTQSVPEIPHVIERIGVALRVVVDPISTGTACAGGLFYINVNPEEHVSAIRRAVSQKLGDVSMGIFKVSIPWQARGEARDYAERWDIPVNLIASFPSYNLDDPQQLVASLGPAGWTFGQTEYGASPKIKDWWPNSISQRSDLISVLVRVDLDAPSDCIPLTCLALFAPPDPPRSARPSSSGAQVKVPRRLPVVVDIASTRTVKQLKAAVLEADGRPAECLDSVVVWRVEMSEEEMLIIAERGGLKGGKMPFPYPAGSLTPVKLSDPDLPISRYFPDTHSKGRMVNLSVWIHPNAIEKLARVNTGEGEVEEEPPLFTYPKIMPNKVTAQGNGSIPTQGAPTVNSLAISPPPTNSTFPPSRGRPRTAPAFSSTGNSQSHSFGFKSSGAVPRAISPLASSSSSTAQNYGVAPSPPQPAHSQPSSRSGSDASEDLGSIPSLSFSALTLDTPDLQGLKTPEVDKAAWLSPQVEEHGPVAKGSGWKAHSLGPYWQRAPRIMA